MIFSFFHELSANCLINVQKAFEAGDIGLYPLSEAVQVEEQKGELLQKFLRESRYGGYVEHIVHEAEVPEVDDADEEIGSHTALKHKVHLLRGTEDKL